MARKNKFKEIIRQDFYKDQQKVCNLFYVFDNQTCSVFANCYIERAVSAMPSKLLTSVAKDIKYGNSSAIHTYEIINGKKIGEDCLSEILSLPK